MFLHQTLFRRFPSYTPIYSIALFKGERPTPKFIELNWQKFNTKGTDGKGAGTNLLWTGNFVMNYNYTTKELYSDYLSSSGVPFQAGTASWAILMPVNSGVAYSTPWDQASNTLSSSYTQFATLGVSLMDGDAPVRLQTFDIKPSNGTLNVVEFSLRAA